MKQVKSKMKSAVQTAVSGDRMRFEDSNHNLDLTYITKNLIAMAFPASGLEATYRNDIDDVSRMLNHYHGTNYMVWNLSGRRYDYSKFHNQVLEYYFPDHHSPPLNLLFQIIVSMDSWLSADPANVAVVHCIGGKGRTGTVMACFMTYKGIFNSPMEALVYFGLARSTKQRGVTQVSQRRYVDYFAKILFKGVRPHPHKLRVIKVMMSSVPRWQEKGCRPYIHIYDTNNTTRELIFTTKYSDQTRLYSNFDDPVFWLTDVVIKGDILLKFYHLKLEQHKVYEKVVEGRKKKKYSSSMFRASIHTAFVDLDSGCLALTLDELDIYKKPKKFVEDMKRAGFSVQIFFEVLPEGVEDCDTDSELAVTYHKFFQRRVVMREESQNQLDEVVVRRLNGYLKAGMENLTTNMDRKVTENVHEEGTDDEKEDAQEKEVGEDGENGNEAENGNESENGNEEEEAARLEEIQNSNEKELENERRRWTAFGKPMDIRKLGKGSRISNRFSIGQSAVTRQRLFSFRTTKKKWEDKIEQEKASSVPNALGEAETDEELELTASESESDSESESETEDITPGEDEKKRQIEEEINRELEDIREWVSEERERETVEKESGKSPRKKEGKEDGEGKCFVYHSATDRFLQKRHSGYVHPYRHSWGSAIGKRRATTDGEAKNSNEGVTRKVHTRSNPTLAIGVGGNRLSTSMKRDDLDTNLKRRTLLEGSKSADAARRKKIPKAKDKATTTPTTEAEDTSPPPKENV